MATTIQPTGTSGVANLPGPSQGTLSGNQIPEDGMAWGAQLAQETSTDQSFNLDTYAASTAASMASAGYSPSAVTQYLNAMYAGYLAAGGEYTEQANGATGASSNAQTGIYSPSINAGTLSLPGTGQEPPVGGSSGLPLNASTAAMIGLSLASSNTVNYQQWRANMEDDLTGAGYSPSAVTLFMGEIDQAFYGANSQDFVNVGVQAASGAVSSGAFSSSTQLENYISNSLVPSLQNQGFTADQINQFVEGYRAAIYGGGDSGVVASGLVAGQELASQQLTAGSSFNLDNYASSVASALSSAGYSPQQQQAYMDAMYAGYLRGGGTQTTEATSVAANAPSTVMVPPATGSTNSVSGGTGGSTGPAVSVGAAPWWATQIYTAGAAGEISSPLVTADAINVMSANSALSQAAALYAASPTSTHLANLQTQWENSRTVEAQFWTDLSATNTPYAATAATIAMSFHTDLYFTMEGDMPGTFAAGSIPAASSTPAVIYLTQLAASSALGNGVSLPSNFAQILDNPAALSSMTSGQFDSLAEGMIALYASNPAEYYSALQSITDPNLKATLNYAVQDTMVNSADSLVQNGASVTKENTALTKFFTNAQANPSTYAAWMPSANTNTSTGTGLQAMPTSTPSYSVISNYLSQSSYTSNPSTFALSAEMLAGLWATNQQAYYQVLSGVPNTELRNALNAAVQKEYTNNPQDVAISQRATTDFEALLPQVLNKTGPQASSATWIGTGSGNGSDISISSQVGGLS